MKREWTVVADTREKRALPLPSTLVVRDWSTFHPQERMVTVRIHSREQTMVTGDYYLDGYSHECLVERKGSVRELATNLLDSKDRVRFFEQLRRLRDQTRVPILFVEGDPLSWDQKRTDGVDPLLVRDCLLQAQHWYGVQLVMLPCNSVGARRAATAWLICTMLSAVHNKPLPLPQPEIVAPSSIPLPSVDTVPGTQP